MEWLEWMKNSITYIEDHLEGQIVMDDVARAACSSKFHFQRMFHMLTGVTVAEYIRRRRLTLAAHDLTSSNIKVLDLAFKYGYESPESFAKSFQKLHGLTPSAARVPGAVLKAYPRLSFHISLTGDQDMNYKMMDKEAFEVIGKAISVTTREGENSKIIPAFWRQSHEDGFIQRLEGLTGKDAMTYGICMEFNADQDEFTYMIAIDNTNNPLAEDLEKRVIPAATWAVFESIGAMPDAIQKVWNRIYTEWFPDTGYEHANAPELEVYPQSDPYDENYRCEVWIPVIKK